MHIVGSQEALHWRNQFNLVLPTFSRCILLLVCLNILEQCSHFWEVLACYKIKSKFLSFVRFLVLFQTTFLALSLFYLIHIELFKEWILRIYSQGTAKIKKPFFVLKLQIVFVKSIVVAFSVFKCLLKELRTFKMFLATRSRKSNFTQ